MIRRGAKHTVGHCPPPDLAVGVEHLAAKVAGDLLDDVVLLEHLVCDPVGIDHLRAVGRKPRGHGRLPRANSTDEPDDRRGRHETPAPFSHSAHVAPS